MIKVLGIPNSADLIPILKPFDPQRLKSRVVKIFKRMDPFYEKLIEERLKLKRGKTSLTSLTILVGRRTCWMFSWILKVMIHIIIWINFIKISSKGCSL